MNITDIQNIKTLLNTPKKVVIVGHKSPDGDAIGSTLGLAHYLKLSNHNVTVMVPDQYPDFLKWIPGQEDILIYDNNKADCDTIINNADVLFTLDFNAFHRTGNMEGILEQSKAIKIMIDHHQQPDSYPTYMYSDTTMSSTCQMVYHFIDKLGAKEQINKDIATCLYVGIMTDTGSFRFRSTTSTTHRVIAYLIDCGADNTAIHNKIYDTNSFSRLQLLGRALNNLKVIPELNTAYIQLSQDELNEFNFKKGDTEGVVNYALSLNNIKMAAIFIEDKSKGIIKISLRSKGDFSVNELSRSHFEGGGHTNAAGGKSDLSLDETITKFLSVIKNYQTELECV